MRMYMEMFWVLQVNWLMTLMVGGACFQSDHTGRIEAGWERQQAWTCRNSLPITPIYREEIFPH